jgi:hypothetical protein
MGYPEIRPPVDQKRLNRSTQNFVGLIMMPRPRKVPILVAIGVQWRPGICVKYNVHVPFIFLVPQTHTQTERDVVERRIMTQTTEIHART